MPAKRTLKRARKDKREGKAASTQAGEFVREEIEHIREGKHGARSARQAIAIGLSKARRAGVDLLLMHRVTTQGMDAGFRACEASWILEDNRDMLGPLETIGFRPYRRYRIYEKSLR